MLGGKYRLERLIGAGGMAAVYEGVHRNGHRVAIKMLHPNLSLDAGMCERFRREGYVANNVKHRGAVQVIDDDRAEDGSVFLVMELLQGATLETRRELAGGRLPSMEVCELAKQLLDVLAAAHERGITHRDIKPENLFLTDEGVLKVLDFGIARLEQPNAVSVTRTGQTIGTPAFMPPEQALGKSALIDGRTDLWAVGATMFALMSGQYVHEGETVTEVLVFAASRPARPLAAVFPEAPPAIASVVDRALAFERDGRWPDARTMGAALADAYRAAYGGSLPLGGAGLVQARLGASGTEIGQPSAIARAAGVSSGQPPVPAASTTAGLAQTAADLRGAGAYARGVGSGSGDAGTGPGRAVAGDASRGRSIKDKAVVALLVAAVAAVALIGLAAMHGRSTGSAVPPPASALALPPAPRVELRPEAVAGQGPAAPPARPSPASKATHEAPVAVAAAPAPIKAPAPVAPAAMPVQAPAPPRPAPSPTLCHTDPFTGRIQPVHGAAAGDATFPCSQDPFTGAYVHARGAP